MEVKKAVDEYRYAIIDKSRTYQRWAMQKVNLFAEWCEGEKLAVDDLTPGDVRRFLEYVRTKPNDAPYRSGQLASQTVRGYAQVVKGFLNFCHKEEIIRRDICKRVEMPKAEGKVIETFSPEQIKRLFAACDQEYLHWMRVRDAAILSVLLDTGIRADELCTLTLENCHLEPHEPYIKVHGKGNRWREVGLSNSGRRTLHRYLSRFRPKCEVDEVFVSRKFEPLTPNGLDQTLYRLRDWAHITGVRCSAHTFRHTFAVHFLLSGGDVYVLSRILGHAHVNTTEIYLRAVKQRQVRQTGRQSLLDLV